VRHHQWTSLQFKSLRDDRIEPTQSRTPLHHPNDRADHFGIALHRFRPARQRQLVAARQLQRPVFVGGLVAERQRLRGMYVRGLSTRDVSDLYGEAFGASRMSKSTVSRITQQLNREFEAWRQRDLSELKVVYLFLDGQYHAVRQGTDEKEGVLSAYALLEDGHPVLLHLDLGPRESYDAWLSFLQDLSARGLADPLLVIFDGAPGLKKAIKRMWPRAFRQRCLVHKMRNILAKLPRLMQARMKRLVRRCSWRRAMTRR
jgi:transposase-like protein